MQKQKEEFQRQREIYQLEFNEKIQENDKLVLECNEINKRREGRPYCMKKRKKVEKKLLASGVSHHLLFF